MPNVTASYGTPLDFIAFFGIFYTLLTTIHVWITVSPPNFHRLCDRLVFTFWYITMSNATAGYGSFSNFCAFFRNFHKLLHVWNVFLDFMPTGTCWKHVSSTYWEIFALNQYNTHMTLYINPFLSSKLQQSHHVILIEIEKNNV